MTSVADPAARRDGHLTRPVTQAESSTFFAVVDVEGGQSVGTESHGDLWPSTWADDGHLYTACGDGLGFSTTEPWSDVVVNRVEGTPETGLHGTRLASGRDVSPVWTDAARCNSKPTGMVAVDGDADGRDELYLAVQDLPFGADPHLFDEAPAAGIVRSDDRGLTWHPPRDGRPLFTDHVFTTVMFLDLGQSNRLAEHVEPQDGGPYVYAFGLDHNWRTSYTRAVPDPEDLFLARVPAAGIQDRERWQFHAGTAAGRPEWSAEIDARVPVLSDQRRRHPDLLVTGARGGTLLGQGGVVYDAPLARYLYTSWTEYTFEIFEAPHPWGPWRLALTRDFGPFPWAGPDDPHPRHGGYGTTLPSKFISTDGRDAWLQSNWFWRASTHGGRSYHFSLRRLRLDPTDPAPAVQPPPGQNLADPSTGARVIASACRSGHPEVLNDGRADRAEDSWNGTAKGSGDPDHWGYVWRRPLRVDRLVLTAGPYDTTAGWFAEVPRVEIRIDGRWCDAVGQQVSPEYRPGPEATGGHRWTLTFAEASTDGVRVVGRPGGYEAYTSIAELEVYCDGARAGAES